MLSLRETEHVCVCETKKGRKRGETVSLQRGMLRVCVSIFVRTNLGFKKWSIFGKLGYFKQDCTFLESGDVLGKSAHVLGKWGVHLSVHLQKVCAF